MRQGFRRDAVSCIADLYLCIRNLISCRLTQTESDAPLFCILDGIGYQIIQYNSNDLFIKE